MVAKILEFEGDQNIKKGITGAVLLSGLYDLSTMKKSYLNQSLRLSEEDVNKFSPIYGHIKKLPETILAVGENETEEFIRQSRGYSTRLGMHGHSHEFLLLENKNHYTVARMLSNRDNILMEKIHTMCRL